MDQFQFKLIHRKGVLLVDADALTRVYVYLKEDISEILEVQYGGPTGTKIYRKHGLEHKLMDDKKFHVGESGRDYGGYHSHEP